MTSKMPDDDATSIHRSLTRVILYLIAVSIGTSCPTIASAAVAGDLACGRQTFKTPVQCITACSKQLKNRGLGNLGAGQCVLKPSTPDITANKRIDQLRYIYNDAVLHLGPVPPDQEKFAVIGEILMDYFPPYNLPVFDVEFSSTTKDWARAEEGSGEKKPTLTIANDLARLKSPAFMIAAIGHEMVHMNQYARTYTTVGIFGRPQSALMELEAYSWELNRDSFKHTFKSLRLTGPMTDQEKQEIEEYYNCYAWFAKQEIRLYMGGPYGARYGKQFAQWLTEDPWVSSIWLPQNPDWATQQPGNMPPYCSYDANSHSIDIK